MMRAAHYLSDRDVTFINDLIIEGITFENIAKHVYGCKTTDLVEKLSRKVGDNRYESNITNTSAHEERANHSDRRSKQIQMFQVSGPNMRFTRTGLRDCDGESKTKRQDVRPVSALWLVKAPK